VLMTRERWMALLFAAGSTGFLIAPFPGYASLVGRADSVTFFVGSILFTAGAGVQSSLAFRERHSPDTGSAAWRAAAIQSAGTLAFNVTTYRAMHAALRHATFHKLVWRPDTLGSICFLISGAVAYRACARHGWLPVRHRSRWWEPAINLLGCLFFLVSAAAGNILPTAGSPSGPAVANWNICLGAACFLSCALATLLTGRTSKSPRLNRLDEWEHDITRNVDQVLPHA
jgi:hypothetical protein